MTRSGRCFYSEGIDSCRKLSTVKYWIINWFLPENSQITWRDKGQVVRLSTAGDWMEGYKCIFEMKSWPIDVLMTWKWGLFQRHVCTIQYIGSYHLGDFVRDPLHSYFDEPQKKWYSSLIFILCFYIIFTGPGSTVGKVFASRNGRSWVQSQVVTYPSH